ncbi:hypothetical protein N7452_005487 [Penicillium brevicompactum]|uniref:Uncharacterized protein n=1 Tax=Penicillium brevicompactum TaxID=5074 RepID=A0A9W9QLI2_PENBR|nr:hypothetical protein N7452_005487 [Penicillium brevicompactum]
MRPLLIINSSIIGVIGYTKFVVLSDRRRTPRDRPVVAIKDSKETVVVAHQLLPHLWGDLLVIDGIIKPGAGDLEVCTMFTQPSISPWAYMV